MNKVYRCFAEKREGFDVEARGLCAEVRGNLGVKSLERVRIFNRYDVQGIGDEAYASARISIFSEPQCDDCFDEVMPEISGSHTKIVVEALPGQYDQRADSCAQCIQIMTCGDRPIVKSARVYVLYGELSETDIKTIETYLINPVESRRASEDKPETLEEKFTAPDSVATLNGFIAMDDAALSAFLSEMGLAMDMDDLRLLQSYFRDEEGRDPTITEVKMVDTYWSDHCRHTTFGTHIKDITIDDDKVQSAFDKYISARVEIYGDRAKDRAITLMDIATCGAKVLKKRGILKNLDESEEINACSVHVSANVNGEEQDWLLMFKNETHNHPTEIEPFGGAATCLGGAIRDPLSGRSYVYQAMRVTGSGDPRVAVSDTLPGKLPQRKITQTAAAGYSSYGNQIGLATGLVHEVYHPGYVAKRMEIGAVVGAAPASAVRREVPVDGDVIILLGGKTGRDGCGGATGSSKTHTLESLTTCGSEVQKGNPPEERKIQRLFRDENVTRLIKRCNDFGAGGVSVAIGELADGLTIDLDKVPKKYEGLDGTELAISESQERMAVVVAAKDADAFIAYAARENLDAVIVARVTEAPRLVMNWNGKKIVDLSRKFLNSNGADKVSNVNVPKRTVSFNKSNTPASERLKALAQDLNIASQRGLGERFDSTIGAGSVLHPFGGKNQLTPTQVMAAKLPVLKGETDTCSVMSYGFNPFVSEQDPYTGAESAVVESVAKLVAAGCDYRTSYLTFQEYFERLREDATRWGKPFAALLGGFNAQVELGIGAIGGKDSMSGSFMDMDVPPTLVSFAICPEKVENVLSPEFKAAGNKVYFFEAKKCGEVPDYEQMKAMWEQINRLCREGKVLSGWAVEIGGIAEGILKMSVGNDIGFKLDSAFDADKLFELSSGSIIIETNCAVEGGVLLGETTADGKITLDTPIEISEIKALWEGVFEPVFATQAGESKICPKIEYATRGKAHSDITIAKPHAVIPVFPGTNCEYDTARAIERAGGEAEILVIRNLNQAGLEESVKAFAAAVKRSQMVVLPGGFSGGDEPEGSGKFIASFLRNPEITDAIHELLKNRDGLMLGICNGFQALIKLGLVPFGEIRAMDDTCPTLTFNLIGRHQSRYVSTAVASVKSPWLSKCNLGEQYSIAMSHGEGRFVASDEMLKNLIANGQVATQYVMPDGTPSLDIAYNPNGSLCAIEGITSPDGRVFGKMGHVERTSNGVGKNIAGEKFQPIFEGGVAYFK
ncbi:MAG: phosphoribosylformylglycinamidine synthase [Clostridia bacterium]|nr:phosphoribosylformylglycinamidine synthase [Clostridia bacterium]